MAEQMEMAEKLCCYIRDQCYLDGKNVYQGLQAFCRILCSVPIGSVGGRFVTTVTAKAILNILYIKTRGGFLETSIPRNPSNREKGSKLSVSIEMYTYPNKCYVDENIFDSIHKHPAKPFVYFYSYNSRKTFYEN